LTNAQPYCSAIVFAWFDGKLLKQATAIGSIIYALTPEGHHDKARMKTTDPSPAFKRALSNFIQVHQTLVSCRFTGLESQIYLHMQQRPCFPTPTSMFKQ